MYGVINVTGGVSLGRRDSVNAVNGERSRSSAAPARGALPSLAAEIISYITPSYWATPASGDVNVFCAGGPTR